MEIKIFPIRMGFDIIYVLRGEGVIAIDGGDPQKIAKFERGIEKAFIKPEEVQIVVLTHGHWDHVGSVQDIKGLTGARVLLHQKDMHFLDDAYPSQPPGFTPWGKFVCKALSLYSPLIRVPRFDVEIVAGDEEISLVEYGIPGKVVPTPGHSWGSVSVLLDSGQAFVGDLAMNMFPLRLNPGLTILGDDLQIVKHSWQKLMDMGMKTVYPAHGKPFSADKVYKSF